MGYPTMEDEIEDRRLLQRCRKDVSMHCSFLHGHADQMVTLRNFSARGIYFESGWNIRPGTLIVLRAMDAADGLLSAASSQAVQYTISRSDPEACAQYRSHTVARVQHCIELENRDEQSLYGVGAVIQILTD